MKTQPVDSMWVIKKKSKCLLVVTVVAILTAAGLLHVEQYVVELLDTSLESLVATTSTRLQKQELLATTSNIPERQTNPLATQPHTLSTNNSTMEGADSQTQERISEADGSISGGYALALDYWEQQTSGSRNLQSLQCWAAGYNLSVVEPIVSRSLLKTPLTNHVLKSKLWFRDFYNIDEWNRQSSGLKHSQLVGWENFIKYAPRDVVLVSFRHAFAKDIKQNLEQLSRSQHRSSLPSQRVRDGCPSHWDPTKQFLHNHRFHVVREVCFNFAYGDGVSGEEFVSHLYGSLSPSSSTVVFSQWRGTGPSSRVHISDRKCGNNFVQEKVGPSKHLLSHVQQYQHKHLGGGGPYISIIARMEKVQALLRARKGHTTLAECFSNLLSVWRETRAQYSLNHTLLAIDMGKYGSNSIHHAGQGTELNFRFQEFFRTLYGGRLTVEEWEDSFEDVAGTEDPGYVAALQQMLAVQGQCVVFIGGGSFQKHAHTLYSSAHQRDKCIRFVDMCTYPFKGHHKDVV